MTYRPMKKVNKQNFYAIFPITVLFIIFISCPGFSQSEDESADAPESAMENPAGVQEATPELSVGEETVEPAVLPSG